jgi:hypothetical protein
MREGGTMLRLMQKDLILNKKLLLINAVIMLATLSYFAAGSTRTPPQVFAAFASLMMAILPATLITQADKFKAMTMGCSLPVGRKAIVQARFALAVAMALAGLLMAFLLGVLVPFSNYGFADLFAGKPILTALTGLGLVLSLILPFTLRHGLKGLLLLLVAFQVLGVVLITAAQLTRSSLDQEVIEAIAGSVTRLHGALGPTGFSLFMMAALSVLLSASYLVSVRVFQNREF